MSLIYLTISKPKKLTPKVSQDWSKLVAIAKESVEDCQEAQLIGDCSISIRGKDGLYPFAIVLKAAHELNFTYKVDFLEGKETWTCEPDA